MTRILADLPDHDIKWRDARAAGQGKSRASVLGEAVTSYRTSVSFEAYFGLWERHGSKIDGLDYKRMLESGQ